MASKYFDEIAKKINPETEAFVALSLDVIDQIHFLLKERGLSQRELAKQLGKSESEISKWLSPGHNLTLKTLAKLSVVLKKNILETPLRQFGYYDNITFHQSSKAQVFLHCGEDKDVYNYSENLKFEKQGCTIAWA